MKDERLDELLKSLPREGASDDFTARVLERIEQPRPRFAQQNRWLAAAAVIFIVVLGGITAGRMIEQKREEERLAAVRAAQAEIARELREVKRLSEQVDPVVYLGSGENVDYLVDFRHLKTSSQPVTHASWSQTTY